MTLTEELRGLLDDRGVEWVDQTTTKYGRQRATQWSMNGMVFRARETWDGWISLVLPGLTPMQAVTEAIGRGTCAMEREPGSDRLWWCSSCQAYHEHESEHPWEFCPRCGAKVVGK